MRGGFGGGAGWVLVFSTPTFKNEENLTRTQSNQFFPVKVRVGLGGCPWFGPVAKPTQT